MRIVSFIGLPRLVVGLLCLAAAAAVGADDGATTGWRPEPFAQMLIPSLPAAVDTAAALVETLASGAGGALRMGASLLMTHPDLRGIDFDAPAQFAAFAFERQEGGGDLDIVAFFSPRQNFDVAEFAAAAAAGDGLRLKILDDGRVAISQSGKLLGKLETSPAVAVDTGDSPIVITAKPDKVGELMGGEFRGIRDDLLRQVALAHSLRPTDLNLFRSLGVGMDFLGRFLLGMDFLAIHLDKPLDGRIGIGASLTAKPGGAAAAFINRQAADSDLAEFTRYADVALASGEFSPDIGLRRFVAAFVQALAVETSDALATAAATARIERAVIDTEFGKFRFYAGDGGAALWLSRSPSPVGYVGELTDGFEKMLELHSPGSGQTAVFMRAAADGLTLALAAADADPEILGALDGSTALDDAPGRGRAPMRLKLSIDGGELRVYLDAALTGKVVE